MCTAKKNIPNLSVRQVDWNPPSRHCIKVNRDESMLDSLNAASCGGIARNHDGKFLRLVLEKLHYYGKLGSCTIMALGLVLELEFRL